MAEVKELAPRHTPGPWKADTRAGCFAVYAGPARNCLSGAGEDAIVYQSGRGERSSPGGYQYLTDEQIANARLIAAAPELLEALKSQETLMEELLRECEIKGDSFGRVMDSIKAMRAAIAKAEGRE